MPYCPRCGVEVEDRLEECPLCGTHIPAEVRELPAESGDYPQDVVPPEPMYRPLSQKQRRALFRGAIGFLALFPVALTSILDMTRNGTISWSYYVIVPVVGTALIAWFFYRFARKPLVSVTGTLLIIVAVYIVINLQSTADLSPMLSVFIVVFLCVEGFLLFVVTRRRRVPGIVGFAAIDMTFLVIALELLIRAESGSAAFSVATGSGSYWSLIVAAVLVPIALYNTYLLRVRRKGLNLGGFFFLDLAVMLLGIDLATGGGVGWSAITALVFIPLAAILYILHVALFNDTDWRKVLHL